MQKKTAFCWQYEKISLLLPAQLQAITSMTNPKVNYFFYFYFYFADRAEREVVRTK